MDERELEEAMKQLAKAIMRRRRSFRLMLLGAIVGAPAMRQDFE